MRGFQPFGVRGLRWRNWALALLLLLAPPAHAGETAPAVPEIRAASLKDILASDTGTLELYHPDGNERILFLKFPSLAEQARMLNRVAAFVEKKGAPKDRVMSGAELADFIKGSGTEPEDFYLGHDYAARDLARFFAEAAHDQETLNPDEELLRRILIAEKAIRPVGGGYEAEMPPKAAISYAEHSRPGRTDQAEPDYASLRCTVAEHELSHGVYFTQARYSASVGKFWRHGMSAWEREVFTAFLVGLDYDSANEDLMINETQAFLMHTPDVREFCATLVGLPEVEVQSLRQRFAAATPPVPLLKEMAGYCPQH